MRRLWVVALLLVSCGGALQPLTPFSSAKPDPALVGTWVPIDKKSEKETFVVTAKGAQFTVFLPNSGGDSGAHIWVGHVSVLSKDLKILNLYETDTEHPATRKPDVPYAYYRYAVNADGTLDVWELNDEFVLQAIKDGKLTGKEQGMGVLLSDPPEKLVAFFKAAKPDELFVKLMTFRRK